MAREREDYLQNLFLNSILTHEATTNSGFFGQAIPLWLVFVLKMFPKTKYLFPTNRTSTVGRSIIFYS